MNNKKGFGDVISAFIMFIAVISVTTGLIVIFKNYVSNTQDSFNIQNKLASSKLRTSLSISTVFYNVTTNTSYTYIKNIGETKLVTNLFDLYIDNEFITNYTTYYASNLSKKITLLNPQDTMVIVKQINLSTGNHEIKVITQYGNSVTTLFNI